MKEKEEDRVCGACCHFEHEDIDGWGVCPFQDSPIGSPMHCSDLCTTDMFASEEEKRHHLLVLRKCQRSLRCADKKDLDVKAISEAIDFVVEFVKLY